MKILHIITRDKFTSGYVNFMKINFAQHEHFFVMYKTGFKLDFVDYNNVFYYGNSNDFVFNRKLKNIIKASDKIIITGLFDEGVIFKLFYYNKKIWNKIYLQFWGGDFYQFRDSDTPAKRRTYFLEAVLNCGGVINLIAQDYEALRNTFCIKNDIPHYTAVMPEDPRKNEDFSSYRKMVSEKNTLRLLIGNSATKENCHFEVFNLIKHLSNENIEILCPLSYGEEDYKKEVVAEGKRLFDKKFIPLAQFYERKEYIKLLSTCDIGIFGNNRQQAMGNIAIMIQLDKKLYLRSGTSMFSHYENLGIKLNTLDEMQNIDFSQLKEYDTSVAEKNRLALEKYYATFIDGWKALFDSKLNNYMPSKKFTVFHNNAKREVFMSCIKSPFVKSKRFAKRLLKGMLPKKVREFYKSK